MHFVTKSWK